MAGPCIMVRMPPAPDMTATPALPSIRPLCVDLDGTLIRSDVLTEAIFLLLARKPAALLLFPGWLLRGKAYFKTRIAERVQLDPALLPYHEEFIGWLREERQRGRRILLVTAAHEQLARPIAAHVGLFADTMASDIRGNLAGLKKAAHLTREFGPHGFDYAGNSRVDLPVWAAAGEAIVVNAPARVLARAQAQGRVSRVFAGERSLGAYLRALRPHRWLENLLVFVPLLAAQRIADVALLGRAALAFTAFCLCASAGYLLNDLADLPADRRDPASRNRSLAAGDIPIQHAAALVPVLILAAFVIAAVLPGSFAGVLAIYVVISIAYSFALQGVAVLSVIIPAVSWTLRIIAGGAAAGIESSIGLLAVSLTAFIGLAYLRHRSRPGAS